ncbi:MAG: CoA transferase [Chloroflexi bacterium]|nr:CoA transferase [Chloroflexota bacterium]
MTAPLQGIRVLDLSRILSGPFCTMLLADLGAEVVKVEQPVKGDPARYLGARVGSDSAYFISVNRGKKSITLNIASEEGRRLLLSLLPHFDVLVENFVPGTMARLELDYPRVSLVNPRLVYASISGFGQDGPYAQRPALDIVVQAMGGIMSITGEPGGPPIRPGVSLGDSVAGTFAALAIVAALFQRQATGQGQYIDTAMLDCQLTLMENPIARYFATGQLPGPLGTRHPAATPFQAFQASDSYFVLALITDDPKTWGRLCDAIRRPDLGADLRFQDNTGRMEHQQEVVAALQQTFHSRPASYWLEVLEQADIPCGPVSTVADVIRDPQVEQRGMVAAIPHKELGSWRVANTPFRLGGAALGPSGPSPALGQHTREVLSSLLDITEEALARLRAQGAI